MAVPSIPVRLAARSSLPRYGTAHPSFNPHGSFRTRSFRAVRHGRSAIVRVPAAMRYP
jgi:hypothetical protein